METLTNTMIAWLEQLYGKMTDRSLNLDGLQVGGWRERQIIIVFRSEGPHFMVIPSWPCRELRLRWADPKLFDKLETVFEELERPLPPEVIKEFIERIRGSRERSS